MINKITYTESQAHGNLSYREAAGRVEEVVEKVIDPNNYNKTIGKWDVHFTKNKNYNSSKFDQWLIKIVITDSLTKELAAYDNYIQPDFNIFDSKDVSLRNGLICKSVIIPKVASKTLLQNEAYSLINSLEQSISIMNQNDYLVHKAFGKWHYIVEAKRQPNCKNFSYDIYVEPPVAITKLFLKMIHYYSEVLDDWHHTRRDRTRIADVGEYVEDRHHLFNGVSFPPKSMIKNKATFYKKDDAINAAEEMVVTMQEIADEFIKVAGPVEEINPEFNNFLDRSSVKILIGFIICIIICMYYAIVVPGV